MATENKSLFARIWEIPELKQKLLFTLTMLAVYRIGVFVTLPGVNRNAMAEYFTGVRRPGSSASSTPSAETRSSS